jgi:hypothetical protein
LLPDLAGLQRDAKDYVLKQAEMSLFGDEGSTPEAPGERAEPQLADEWEFPEYVTGMKKK